MKRRFALLAVLAAGLAPAPAWAQDATPVVGSGSFNTAPILEPGTYRDTVLPEEYLYYAVRVQAGQQLHVTANTDFTFAELQDLGLAFVQVNLHAPDRVPARSAQGDSSFTGAGSEPADVITQPASTVAEASGSTTSAWSGPGVYFISVYAVFVGSGELTRAEIPIEFTVAVEGQAQGEPTPTPSPTATAAPSATAAPTVQDGGRSPALAAGAGVGGLLVGVIGGIALRRRRP